MRRGSWRAAVHHRRGCARPCRIALFGLARQSLARPVSPAYRLRVDVWRIVGMAMENASRNRAVLRLELQIKRHLALNAGLFRPIPGRKPRMSFRGNGVAAVCWPPPPRWQRGGSQPFAGVSPLDSLFACPSRGLRCCSRHTASSRSAMLSFFSASPSCACSASAVLA